MTGPSQPSRLWAVHAGYGLFVVRAETEEDARRVAVEHEDGAGQYGHGPDDIEDVIALEPNGPDDLLTSHYG